MIKWNEVTWYSKFLAAIFFVCVLPVLCFYIGSRYGEVKKLDLDLLNYFNDSQNVENEYSSNTDYSSNQSNIIITAFPKIVFQGQEAVIQVEGLKLGQQVLVSLNESGVIAYVGSDGSSIKFNVPYILPSVYHLSVETSSQRSNYTNNPTDIEVVSNGLSGSVSNGLVINGRYGYQFNYDPSILKVDLVGTKFDPQDYETVHVSNVPVTNPGNPTLNCYGDNEGGISFALFNETSSDTTTYSNKNQLSVNKTIKVGQQKRALFPGEENNSILKLYEYVISNGSRNIRFTFSCVGNKFSDQDRIKYGDMTQEQEDAWLENVEAQFDQIVMTFKFIN